MKRTLAFLMAILLLAAALPGVAEEWEDACSPTLEDQLVEMSAWIQEAIKARNEEDYAREAFLLQRITGYSTELFPDEVAWAWAELGDLYLEGLYQIEDEEDANFGKTAEELAALCYEQARKVYDETPEIGRRDDERHLILQTKLAVKLGKLYASPESGLMDYEKAVSQLDFAVRLSWTEEESAEAHYWLGLIYLDAASGRMDEQEGKNELYQAAHAGHEAAFQKLKELIGDDAWEWAQYYLWDNDFDAAVQMLLPAAEQGNVECMKQLAFLYHNGMVGNPAGLHDDAVREENRNREQAVFWYRKAAETGDAEAMTMLVYAFDHAQEWDEPTLISEEEAVSFGTQAAQSGDEHDRAIAAASLGTIYQRKKDYEQAEAWFIQAEEWLWLGRMYRDEEEIKDYGKATAYLLKEAENSEGAFFSIAVSELRDLYLDPYFGPVECDKLAKLYQLAYEKGYTAYLTDLAMLYLDPQYGMLDTERGMYWMFTAASQAYEATETQGIISSWKQKKRIEDVKAWFEAWGKEHLE